MARARSRHRTSAGHRDWLGLTLRGTGQTLLTLGAVVLLFAVYEVWITNIFSHRAQTKVRHVLEKQWATGQSLLALPEGQIARHEGDGLANLYIPRFGDDYVWTIVEGTSDSDLAKGPGHYAGTQLPGEAGDFAVAGHRVGKGEPFLNLDKLKAGDPVIVETERTWYVYCVIGGGSAGSPCDPNATGGSLSQRDLNGVPGREIVNPSDGAVVLPVPSKADAPTPYTTAYLTLTTCTPKFTASQRMIIHAVLDPAYPQGIAKAADGNGFSSAVPAQIKALYAEVGA